jgi:HK97 family phage prohead protease
VAERQFKQLPYFAIKAADADAKARVRRGIAAVFGNVDAGGDRIMPGAFAKTISEGSKRVKHLWNHDFSTPPIASITELKEVGRDELPSEVIAYAPEATGGLLVAREYYDTPLSDWVLKAIDAGDISEMSFGYDVLRHEEIKEGDRSIRELKELKLFDTSDVNWGMNAATVAAGAKTLMPLGVLVQQFQSYAEDVKAGRRNASADQALIDMVHDAMIGLGASNCPGMQEPTDTTPKSEQAEAALNRTSLDLLKLKTRALHLQAATL